MQNPYSLSESICYNWSEPEVEIYYLKCSFGNYSKRKIYFCKLVIYAAKALNVDRGF